MSSYRLRPKAIEDLETIGDFIAAGNPAKAVAFVDELIGVCSRIAAQPRAFQPRDDLAEGMRQAVHRRYLILFTADDLGVVIERVVHGARRLEYLFRPAFNGSPPGCPLPLCEQQADRPQGFNFWQFVTQRGLARHRDDKSGLVSKNRRR